MNGRKTHFEVVPLAEIAPLLQAAPARAILSVSYDTSLARTREMLFSNAGFQVSSVLTVAEAVRECGECPFALIVIGHSIPLKDRETLVKALRSRFTHPILALIRPNESPPPGDEHLFDTTERPTL